MSFRTGVWNAEAVGPLTARTAAVLSSAPGGTPAPTRGLPIPGLCLRGCSPGFVLLVCATPDRKTTWGEDFELA